MELAAYKPVIVTVTNVIGLLENVMLGVRLDGLGVIVKNVKECSMAQIALRSVIVIKRGVTESLDYVRRVDVFLSGSIYFLHLVVKQV